MNNKKIFAIFTTILIMLTLSFTDVAVSTSSSLYSSWSVFNSNSDIEQYPVVADGYLWNMQTYWTPTLQKISLTTNQVLASVPINGSVFEAFSPFILNGLIYIPGTSNPYGGRAFVQVLDENTLKNVMTWTSSDPTLGYCVNIINDGQGNLLFGFACGATPNFVIMKVPISQSTNLAAYGNNIIVAPSPNPAYGCESYVSLFNSKVYVVTSSYQANTAYTILYSAPVTDLTTWTKVWEKSGLDQNAGYYFSYVDASDTWLGVGVVSNEGGTNTYRYEIMNLDGTWFEVDTGVYTGTFPSGTWEMHPNICAIDNNGGFLCQISCRHDVRVHSFYFLNAESKTLTFLFDITGSKGYNDRQVGIDTVNNVIYVADAMGPNSQVSQLIKIVWNSQLQAPKYLTGDINPNPSPTPTPSPTVTPTSTPTPTLTPTPTPTSSPTSSPTPKHTPQPHPTPKPHH